MRQRLVIGVFLLLLFAWGYGSGLTRPFENDEDKTLRWYAKDLPTALIDYSLPNNQFLNSATIWGVTQVVGTSRPMTRFAAYAAGLLALALCFRWGARTYGWPIGALALCILALTGAMLHYGNTARGYTWMTVETTALLMLLNRRRPGRWLLTLLAYAMVITVPTLIFALFSAALYHMLRWRNTRTLAPFAGGAILGALHYLPAYSAGVVPAFSQTFGRGYLYDLLIDFIRDNTFALPAVLLLVCAGILAGLMVSQDCRHLVLAFLTGALVMTIAGQWVMHTYFYGRNYIYLLPPLALCTAVGWAELAREVPRALRWNVPAREWEKGS